MTPEQFLDVVNHQFNFIYDGTKDVRMQKKAVNTCLDVIKLLNFFADPQDLDRLVNRLKEINNKA